MARWKTNLPCKGSGDGVKLIAVTGGPGAGKSAVLEFARRNFCSHVVEVPESASIVFGGGFWRRESIVGRRAAQRAIFHVQREMERIVLEEKKATIGLCDRGTVDGSAYWPNTDITFWDDLQLDRAKELERYYAVIHLKSPSEDEGYTVDTNYLRIETSDQAKHIDEKIQKAWEGHPRRFFIDSHPNFLEKMAQAFQLIKGFLPKDCQDSAR